MASLPDILPLPITSKKEVFEAGFKIVNSFVEIDEFNGNMVVESIKL